MEIFPKCGIPVSVLECSPGVEGSRLFSLVNGDAGKGPSPGKPRVESKQRLRCSKSPFEFQAFPAEPEKNRTERNRPPVP
eukprot:1644545-Heterocapsa_arctica.AAC.1